MNKVLEFHLEDVRAVIMALEQNRFSTADIMRGYAGRFLTILDTPPYYSFNAQFGKFLKRHASDLGIRQIEINASIKDDDGHPTSSSFWQRNV